VGGKKAKVEKERLTESDEHRPPISSKVNRTTGRWYNDETNKGGLDTIRGETHSKELGAEGEGHGVPYGDVAT